MFVVFLIGFILPGIFCENFGFFNLYDNSNGSSDFPDCDTDVEKVGKGIKNGEKWALKMLDSSTKIPSGILTGNLIDFGNYDECLQIREKIAPQYCVATIGVKEDLLKPIIGNSSQSTGLSLRWSYCIPATCPPEYLQNKLQSLLSEISRNVTVHPQDCFTNTKAPLTAGEYVGISIWGIFITTAILSTIYDVFKRQTDSQPNPWLVSFSLYTNCKKLLKTDVSPETMAPLHGLKFLSISWVVLGHRYFYTIFMSLLNGVEFSEGLKDFSVQPILLALFAVDTFLVMSGLLNSYHLLKVMDETNKFPVVKYYVHRYIRLTPVLAAVVLMYGTWYFLIGDGPAWKNIVMFWRQPCIDNWWSTLLYINNYYHPHEQCAGHSWYLAVDMQLYCLSPLVILPLWKRPKFGKILLWVLLLVSTIIQFVVAYVYKLRNWFTFGFDQKELELIGEIIYTPTHTRASPYIMGIMLGHYLYTLNKTKTRLVLSKGLVTFGWFMSTGLCLSVMSGTYQFNRPIEDHPYNRWESSIYIALNKVAWSVGISWLIFSCLNKSGGIVNDILSWRGFIPLSRLTYCMFLSQMTIQQYLQGTQRSTDYFTHFSQVHRFFGDLCLSIILAAGLTLVFESPILVMEKLVMGSPKQRKKHKNEVNNGFEHDLPTMPTKFEP